MKKSKKNDGQLCKNSHLVPLEVWTLWWGSWAPYMGFLSTWSRQGRSRPVPSVSKRTFEPHTDQLHAGKNNDSRSLNKGVSADTTLVLDFLQLLSEPDGLIETRISLKLLRYDSVTVNLSLFFLLTYRNCFCLLERRLDFQSNDGTHISLFCRICSHVQFLLEEQLELGHSSE